MHLQPHMFRQYDIRGVVGSELNDETVTQLSKAFAFYFLQKGSRRVLIGQDNRTSSDPFAELMTSVFLASGLSVVKLGTVTTPMLYFASRVLEIEAGIMITASHNPKDYNGFKVLLGPSTIYGEEIQAIYRLCEEGDWAPQAHKGHEESVDIQPQYRDYLWQSVNLGPKKLKVVLDCGNGTASLSSPEIFKHYAGEVKELYCTSDPDFPNHFPDPTKVANMQEAADWVVQKGFDLAIGLDGDGDRLGVADDRGNMVWGDMLMVLYAREILAKHPGETVLVEVKCSQLLVDEIRKLGGKPVIYKTGHSLIKAKMRELDAILAGEMSGHLFLKDEYFGFDDATYAALRLMRILSNTDQSISQLLSDLPKVFSTPEIRVHVPEKEKLQKVEQAVQYLSSRFESLTIDGVRAVMHGGWGLVRASNTGPELIIRAEGPSPEALDHIKKELELSLRPLIIPWE
ncbi:phosphomannomutase/phosphoglucomutase [bacterium]|nr:phosphomannomutase/phosphoglucomutase [bacterium]